MDQKDGIFESIATFLSKIYKHSSNKYFLKGKSGFVHIALALYALGQKNVESK